MAVAPLRRCCQSDDVARLHFAEHALELHRGEVMALVDDHLAVARDEVRDGVEAPIRSPSIRLVLALPAIEEASAPELALAHRLERLRKGRSRAVALREIAEIDRELHRGVVLLLVDQRLELTPRRIEPLGERVEPLLLRGRRGPLRFLLREPLDSFALLAQLVRDGTKLRDAARGARRRFRLASERAPHLGAEREIEVVDGARKPRVFRA